MAKTLSDALERLRWAFDFLQKDIGDSNAKDIQVQVLKFLGFPDIELSDAKRYLAIPINTKQTFYLEIPSSKLIVAIPDPNQKPSFSEIGINELQNLQDEGIKIISMWASPSLSERIAIDSVSSGAAMTRFDIIGALERSFVDIDTKLRLIRHQRGNILIICGNLRDVFFFVLFSLVNSAENYILRCKDETCKRIFLQVDYRQEYCSRKHARRATVREWMRKKRKAERKNINRKKYERRVHKKLGTKKVKIEKYKNGGKSKHEK